jgi:hypothetical protein
MILNQLVIKQLHEIVEMPLKQSFFEYTFCLPFFSTQSDKVNLA